MVIAISDLEIVFRHHPRVTARRLDLKVGDKVTAIVKSTEVLIDKR